MFDDQCQRGCDRQRQQRQHDVEPQHEDRHPEQCRHGSDQRDQAAIENRLDRLGVPRDPVDGVAHGAVVVEHQAQLLQMLIDAEPEFLRHAQPRAHEMSRTPGAQPAPQHVDHQQPKAHDHQRRRLVVGKRRQPRRHGRRAKNVVDDHFHRPRLEQAGRDAEQR